MSNHTIDPFVLDTIRDRGGNWAVYENQDLGSRDVGHLKFLKFGDGCTFTQPPASFPDDSVAQGHNYRLIGRVDLQAGRVVGLHTMRRELAKRLWAHWRSSRTVPTSYNRILGIGHVPKDRDRPFSGLGCDGYLYADGFRKRNLA